MKSTKKSLTIIGGVFLISLAVFGGMKQCSGIGEPDGEVWDDVVELTMVSMGQEPACGMERFYEALDSMTVPELGVRVRVEYIPWGQEEIQIPDAINNGEKDILCGGDWSDYTGFAQKNAFADLSEYLYEVPELEALLEESLGDDYIKRIGTDGKLFGIPEFGKGITVHGIFYREDLRQKWGIQELDSLERLEEYLYRAKEEGYEYSICDEGVFWHLWNLYAGNRYQFIPDVNNHFVASLEEPEKPILWYSTPEYRECLAIIRRWYQDGIIKKDILVNLERETNEEMARDHVCVEMCSHLYAIEKYYMPLIMERHSEWKLGFVSCGQICKGFPYYKGKLSGTMVSVSSRSEHVEEALAFLEKVFTEEKYSRLVRYGVEGLNYRLEDGKLTYGGVDSANIHRGLTGMTNYRLELESKEIYPGWEQQKQEALQAVDRSMEVLNQVNPYDGFRFMREGLKRNLDGMDKIYRSRLQMLACGIEEDIDGELEAILEELEQAGADAVEAELARQLQVFWEE